MVAPGDSRARWASSTALSSPAENRTAVRAGDGWLIDSCRIPDEGFEERPFTDVQVPHETGPQVPNHRSQTTDPVSTHSPSYVANDVGVSQTRTLTISIPSSRPLSKINRAIRSTV